MAYWDTFESRWDITGVLVTQTGLRVGAGGESAEPMATDLPVLRDVEGQPYIPGSSLRGVLRSHIERIVRGLESPVGPGRGACKPVHDESEWCVNSAQINEWKEQMRTDDKGDTWFAEQVWSNSCRVCQVFGSPWLASRVRLADLHTTDQPLVEVRDGVAIDREKETVKHKYDFEAVTKSARFHMSIITENLGNVEFGLVWLGVRELERQHIQVGGFKGRGLGWVDLKNLAVQGVDGQTLRDYLISGKLASMSLDTADDYLAEAVKGLGGN